MELKSDLLNSVSGYFSLLEDKVQIVLQKGDHPKKLELQDFLTKIVSLSKNLSLKDDDLKLKKSSLTFSIAKKNQEASIFFSGIPGGHEFNLYGLKEAYIIDFRDKYLSLMDFRYIVSFKLLDCVALSFGEGS